MKRIAGLMGFALLASLASAGCQKAERDVPALVVSGSPGMAPLLEEIGARFQSAHPDVRVDVQPTSSDRAVEDTRAGLADVGMIARPLKPGEAGLLVFPLARDGVAIVVHKSNPVPPLTDAQLTGLLTHAYTSWKEVGGTDAPLVVLNQTEGSPLRTSVVEYLGLSSRQVYPGPQVTSSRQALQAIAHQPQAITYTSLASAWLAAQEGQPVRLLPLNGVTPTPDNVADGSYPLVRPLNLLTRGKPRGLVSEFLDFARSAEVHDLVRKHAFSPAVP